jgi:hypothetical protein
MVRSIDLRYEQVRGTHRPNKVARLIGTRVAETILASGLTSCTNRPDIWTQAIRSNLTKLLCHGGRPHMGPGFRRDDVWKGYGGKIYTDAVVTPPSTTIVWPVMKVEASEAR